MNRRSILLCVLTVLLPTVVSAASWNRLEKALDAWEEAAVFDARVSAVEQSEQQYFESGELPAASPGNAIGAGRDERTRGFIVVQVASGERVIGDVRTGDWFAPYVKAAMEAGILDGYRDEAGVLTGAFGPDDTISVEQMAKILVLASMGPTVQCSDMPRNDAARTRWSAAYISCAEASRWTVYADGSVDVGRPVQRDEAIASILQALGREPADIDAPPFADVAPSVRFSGYIGAAKSAGLVEGYSDAAGNPTGMFGPRDTVKRAEFAKMMMTALSLFR